MGSLIETDPGFMMPDFIRRQVKFQISFHGANASRFLDAGTQNEEFYRNFYFWFSFCSPFVQFPDCISVGMAEILKSPAPSTSLRATLFKGDLRDESDQYSALLLCCTSALLYYPSLFSFSQEYRKPRANAPIIMINPAK